MSQSPLPDYSRLASTAGVALAGGGLFHLAGLPAPWLTGPAVAGCLAALLGAHLAVPGLVRQAAFLALGVSMGASLTPETVEGMLRWPLSILALYLCIPFVVGSVQLFLTRVAGWEAREAFLAGVPGALSYTLAIATAAGLDVRKVAVLQTIRLLAVVLVVPLVLGHEAGPVAHGLLVRQPEATASAALVLLAAGLAAGLGFERLSVPAGLLMGGLVASGALHLSGLAGGLLPQALVIPSLAVVGVGIGERFRGTDLATLRRMAGVSLAAVAIAFVVATGAALATASWLGLPALQVLLAFAPGGLEAASVTAFVLGLDAAYVATHQLLRFLGIALALPLVFRWLTPASGAGDG